MCGCEHHWDLNAPCTCDCLSHKGVRAEMRRHEESQRQAARLKAGREALDLLASFVAEDECWFDHHGGCQAHGFLYLKPGDVCPNERAKRLVAEAAS